MGSPSPTTQTTTTQLTPEQQQVLNLAMPGIQSFAANVPSQYPGSTVSPFTASQTAGQNMALGAAGDQANLAGNAARATNNFTSGDIWNPASNPNLTNAINAATRPITQQLTQSTLPAIRGSAVTSGNFGSSRQGIAEGLASQAASTATGDTAAKVAEDEYNTNIDAQLKAIGLTPTVQQSVIQPAVTTSGVGDVQQAQNQSELNSTIGSYNYSQLAPFLQSQELISLLQGIPGGGSTTTGTVPQANPATMALGGAAAGASLGSAIMPGVGTGLGAGAGALLPFLFR